MANAHPHLTSPGRIGAMELRNRFVVTAMGAGLGGSDLDVDDGFWGERIRAYHEEQARGGAGLIISGVVGVAWPIGSPHDHQLALSEDRFIPGVAETVKAVHAHGAKFAVQLHHGGPNAHAARARGVIAMAPSQPDMSRRKSLPVMFPQEQVTSTHARAIGTGFREMALADIQLVTQQFADAARRAVQAGVDGIEIHAAHGYILGSFLSPRTNRRTDDYGGSPENRARFLLDVFRAIRAAVGRDVALWCKLDYTEIQSDPGIQLEDAIRTARWAQEAGVDAITVSSVGNPDYSVSTVEANIPHTPAIHLPAAAKVKAALDIPIIASGRVEMDVAEAAIARGGMDFLGMGRKILADPSLPRKITEGRAADVRPCVYCYTCVSNIQLGLPLRCAVNPRTSFEYEPGPPAATRRKVVVVGGGPAGMEAACRLDREGHEVILLEKQKQLGGTFRFASLAYPANEKLLDWLRRELSKTRVDVRRGVEATPELLKKLTPDAVLVATGAKRARPPVEGANLPHVFSGDDLKALMLGQDSEDLKRRTSALTRLAVKAGAATGLTADLDFVRRATHWWMPLGQRIVVVGGELVGLELAEFLTERGRKVTVVDEAPQFGAGLTYRRRLQLLGHLEHLGVELQRGSSDIRIEPAAVLFTEAEGASRRIEADHVILAKGATGDLSLAETLKAAGFIVYATGDCTGVGYIEGAMRGAANAARAISAGLPPSWTPAVVDGQLPQAPAPKPPKARSRAAVG